MEVNVDINLDHLRFRELFAETVRHRLRYNPIIRDEDWIIKCYFNQNVFESTFPIPAERQRFLDETAEEHSEREAARDDNIELIESIRRRYFNRPKTNDDPPNSKGR